MAQYSLHGELYVKEMTKPKWNSAIFFHTVHQGLEASPNWLLSGPAAASARCCAPAGAQTMGRRTSLRPKQMSKPDCRVHQEFPSKNKSDLLVSIAHSLCGLAQKKSKLWSATKVVFLKRMKSTNSE